MVTAVQMLGFTGDIEQDVNLRTGQRFYRYAVHPDTEQWAVYGGAGDLQEAVQSIRALISYLLTETRHLERCGCGTKFPSAKPGFVERCKTHESY